MTSSVTRRAPRARPPALNAARPWATLSSGHACPPGGLGPWALARSARRVEAHRAVFLAVVLEQRHLIHARFQQAAPVLAEPALGVALAGEDGFWKVGRRDHCAAVLLVAPRPRHARATSSCLGTVRLATLPNDAAERVDRHEQRQEYKWEAPGASAPAAEQSGRAGQGARGQIRRRTGWPTRPCPGRPRGSSPIRRRGRPPAAARARIRSRNWAPAGPGRRHWDRAPRT